VAHSKFASFINLSLLLLVAFRRLFNGLQLWLNCRHRGDIKVELLAERLTLGVKRLLHVRWAEHTLELCRLTIMALLLREHVISLLLNLLFEWQEGGEDQVRHQYGLLVDDAPLVLQLVAEVLQVGLVVVSFAKCNPEKLVLSLTRLYVFTHVVCTLIQVVALIFQMLNLLIVLFLDVHEVLKLSLPPCEVSLLVDDSRVLSQLLVLLLRFRLEMLQLTLNLVHVSLVGVDEVIFVLTQYLYELLIVSI